MLTKSRPDTKSYGFIIFFAVCLSLFLSWLSIHNNYEHNADSLLYIFTARTFLDNGLIAASEVYRWPMLSIVIAKIHSLTGLSLVNAGNLLIISFYAAISWVFISITRDMGGNTRNLLIALIVISFFPTLNGYRDYITRDAGLWLFTLLSLQQLIRLALNNHLKHAFGWFLCVLAAIMFRTEALFFAAFAPLAITFDSHLNIKQKLQKIAVLYSFLFSAAIMGLLIIISTPELSGKLRLFSELSNLDGFITQLTGNYKDSIRVIADAKPYIHFVEDINEIFILGLSGLVVYTILHALTLPYVAILCWPIKNGKSPRNQASTYAIAYLLIIITYLMIKTFHGFFTTNRYCLTAALIILLIIPFKTAAIWDNASHNARRFNWQKAILVLLLLYPVLDSLISSDSHKEYIADATEWVAQNKSPEQQLLTNHKQIAVLGASCLSSCFISDNVIEALSGNLEKYNQLVIRIKRKQATLQEKVNKLLQSEGWTLIKSFSNVEDDRILILSRQSSLDNSTN